MGFVSTFSTTPNFAIATGALTVTIPANAHDWSVNAISGVAFLNGIPLEATNSISSQFTLSAPIVVSGGGTAPKVFVRWGV